MNRLLEAFEPAKFIGPRRTIELEFEDVLWAARGIYGEGGKQPQEFTMKCYLWAIMRRCLLMKNNLSYMEMWQQFSQPINPEWRRDGKFCKPGGKYFNCPECSIERLLRRDKTASMEWTDIPQSIRDTVLTFACGHLHPPVVSIKKSALSNWASYQNVEKKFPWGIDVAGEWFFEDKNLIPSAIIIYPSQTPSLINPS